MNICVIGLGSMGKRRIRIIREMYPNYYIIGVDGREDRRQEANAIFSIECYSDIVQISDKKIDCAFVCTSPLSHKTIISNCLERDWHVFSELNLISDGYDYNIELAKNKKLVLFLSSTFLYREEIKSIRKRIVNNRKWNYIYHIGQYLPDWHPWENYKDFFLGDKRTNGCREILAIELPWLVKTFGMLKNIQVMSGKMTDLKIDYNDNFLIQIEHDNGTKGSLIVDVVSPMAVRKMEIYSEGNYISWGGTPESLEEYNPKSKQLERILLSEETEHIEGYKAFIVENAYKNEIKEFFEVVLLGKKPIYGFEEDKDIIRLIDELGA